MVVSHAQLRQLEMQLEQEHEEKQMVLHEKQDLEGLISTLCEQVRAQSPPQGLLVRRSSLCYLLAATSWLLNPCRGSKHITKGL